MKLSLVLVTAGLLAASAACTPRDRTEVERTTTTTITSAPMDPQQTVATAAEPNVAAAPQTSATAVTPVPRDITPSAPSSTAAATAASPARTTTTAPAATARPAPNRDLVERGQLVGPSMAAPQQPVVIFSNGPGASGSTDFVQPSAASSETPSDFSPKPRSVGPTSTAGQGQINFNVAPSRGF